MRGCDHRRENLASKTYYSHQSFQYETYYYCRNGCHYLRTEEELEAQEAAEAS